MYIKLVYFSISKVKAIEDELRKEIMAEMSKMKMAISQLEQQLAEAKQVLNF